MIGNRRKRISLSLLTWGLVATLSSACSIQARDAEIITDIPQAVEVITVQMEPVLDRYGLAGTLQSMKEAVVSFEVDGRVTETLVQAGDVVKAGDVLASLDASNYKFQLNRAEAAIGQAEASVRQAEASVAAAAVGVETAQQSRDVLSKNGEALTQEAFRMAAYDLNKAESRFEAGSASESDLNNARLAFKQAETNYLNAKAQSNQSSSGVTSAEATLAQARAGLEQARAAHREALVVRDQAQLAVEKSSLASPIEGVVLEKIVSAWQLTGGGQPAYRIGDITQLKVVLPVPDQEIRKWSVGQEVALTLYGESRTGAVKNVYPTTNSSSGSVNVEVLVPNPNADWLPGQVVKAARTSTGEAGILVPIEAVVSTGSKPYVFKKVDGKALKTNVTLGELTNNRLHLTSGLSPGDQIVTKGAYKLFDGDSIATSEERAK
ncbi:efflux RND transporter periplasmic adaptor subunit [Paenibacillus hemerocallicola]|uniref:Efflux RND transporter periplasmic adaptor subunit n=1 Tax=Paenibacillus hemerocallicola TaxID=1172614 RepID=A0A5C4TBV0_9BACL|nr:efflux RND transporter periplasmic adaptor subunit [Paenibacillus hemerocallicola]TNJ65939.1 efflux RND transporter periplasmic adaptor subunit [Paenibacillus hemerocallicola]